MTDDHFLLRPRTVALTTFAGLAIGGIGLMGLPYAVPWGFGIAVLSSLAGIWLYWEDYIELWKTRKRGARSFPEMLLPLFLVIAVLGLGYRIYTQSQPLKVIDPVVDAAQLAEIRKLDSFIGVPDEYLLREKFGLSDLESFNINLLAKCEARVLVTKINACDFSPYKGEDWDYRMNASNTDLYRINRDAVLTAWDPHNVFMIVETPAYVRARKQLVEFENSDILPSPFIGLVTEFENALNDNENAFMDVLDGAAKETPQNFIHANDISSPYFDLVVSRVAARYIPLKPRAEKIRDLARKYWSVR